MTRPEGATVGNPGMYDLPGPAVLESLLATGVSFAISDPTLRDNPLVWVSPAFTHLTGYPGEEAVGRNSRFLQAPGSDATAVAEMRRALAEQRPVAVTVANRRKDGTAFWNEVSISPVFDDEGRLTNFVGVQTDVTARVQAESEREAAYLDAERARARLGILAEVSVALSGTLDVAEALGRLAHHVVPALADWCAVDMLEPHGVRRVAVAHRDPERAEALRAIPPIVRGRAGDTVRRVLGTGQSVLFDTVDEEVLARTGGPPERLALIREVGVTSGVVVPLRARSRVVGTLSLGISDESRRYDQSDLQLATDLGRRAGLAVENARLYSREHEVAVALQRSMLPALPDVPGLEVSAHYFAGSPGADVGGDWYDVLPLPDGSVGIAIGDVMGHDVTAAAAMGQLRSVLRSYAWEGHRPAEVLDRLDRLVQGLGMAHLATCVYGRLEPVEGGALLRYANAGHLPPMVQLRNGDVQMLDAGKSVLIGAPGTADRSDASEVIGIDSTLLLYTDGLVEDRGIDVDAGVDRLCALVGEHDPALGIGALCDRLLDELLVGPRTDDAAVMAIRISAQWASTG